MFPSARAVTEANALLKAGASSPPSGTGVSSAAGAVSNSTTLVIGNVTPPLAITLSITSTSAASTIVASGGGGSSSSFEMSPAGRGAAGAGTGGFPVTAPFHGGVGAGPSLGSVGSAGNVLHSSSSGSDIASHGAVGPHPHGRDLALVGPLGSGNSLLGMPGLPIASVFGPNPSMNRLKTVPEISDADSEAGGSYETDEGQLTSSRKTVVPPFSTFPSSGGPGSGRLVSPTSPLGAAGNHHLAPLDFGMDQTAMPGQPGSPSASGSSPLRRAYTADVTRLRAWLSSGGRATVGVGAGSSAMGPLALSPHGAGPRGGGLGIGPFASELHRKGRSRGSSRALALQDASPADGLQIDPSAPAAAGGQTELSLHHGGSASNLQQLTSGASASALIPGGRTRLAGFMPGGFRGPLPEAVRDVSAVVPTGGAAAGFRRIFTGIPVGKAAAEWQKAHAITPSGRSSAQAGFLGSHDPNPQSGPRNSREVAAGGSNVFVPPPMLRAYSANSARFPIGPIAPALIASGLGDGLALALTDATRPLVDAHPRTISGATSVSSPPTSTHSRTSAARTTEISTPSHLSGFKASSAIDRSTTVSPAALHSTSEAGRSSTAPRSTLEDRHEHGIGSRATPTSTLKDELHTSASGELRIPHVEETGSDSSDVDSEGAVSGTSADDEHDARSRSRTSDGVSGPLEGHHTGDAIGAARHRRKPKRGTHRRDASTSSDVSNASQPREMSNSQALVRANRGSGRSIDPTGALVDSSGSSFFNVHNASARGFALGTEGLPALGFMDRLKLVAGAAGSFSGVGFSARQQATGLNTDTARSPTSSSSRSGGALGVQSLESNRFSVGAHTQHSSTSSSSASQSHGQIVAGLVRPPSFMVGLGPGAAFSARFSGALTKRSPADATGGVGAGAVATGRRPSRAGSSGMPTPGDNSVWHHAISPSRLSIEDKSALSFKAPAEDVSKGGDSDTSATGLVVTPPTPTATSTSTSGVTEVYTAGAAATAAGVTPVPSEENIEDPWIHLDKHPVYVLQCHLNHPANLSVVNTHLRQQCERRGRAFVRFLRLLSAEFFQPAHYDLRHHIASGAYGTVVAAVAAAESPAAETIAIYQRVVARAAQQLPKFLSASAPATSTDPKNDNRNGPGNAATAKSEGTQRPTLSIAGLNTASSPLNASDPASSPAPTLEDEEIVTGEVPVAVKIMTFPDDPLERCILAEVLPEVAIMEDLVARYVTLPIPNPAANLPASSAPGATFASDGMTSGFGLSPSAPPADGATDRTGIDRTTANSTIAGDRQVSASCGVDTNAVDAFGCPIVCLLDYGVTATACWIVMERCHMSLRSWRVERGVGTSMKPIDLWLYLQVFMCVLQRLQQLHEMGVTHYDVKCDNLLLRDGFEAKVKTLIAAAEAAVGTNGDRRTPKGTEASLLTVDTSIIPRGESSAAPRTLTWWLQLLPSVCFTDFGESTYNPGTTARAVPMITGRGTECIRAPEQLRAARAQQQRQRDAERRKREQAARLQETHGGPSSGVFGRSGATPAAPGVSSSGPAASVAGSASKPPNTSMIPGSACDVWGVGCLLYELITGHFLFQDDDWARFYLTVTGDASLLGVSSLVAPSPTSSGGESGDSGNASAFELPLISDYRLDVLRTVTSPLAPYDWLRDLLCFILVRDPMHRPSLNAILRRTALTIMKLEAVVFAAHPTESH